MTVAPSAGWAVAVLGDNDFRHAQFFRHRFECAYPGKERYRISADVEAIPIAELAAEIAGYALQAETPIT